MAWWRTAWQVLRDVGLTGLGAWIIWKQVYAPDPNSGLLVVAVGLITPAARSAVMAILSGPGSSSESPARSEEQPSPSSRSGVTGERRG